MGAEQSLVREFSSMSHCSQWKMFSRCHSTKGRKFFIAFIPYIHFNFPFIGKTILGP